MVTESDPVADEEWLLRRIYRKEWNGRLPISFERGAFTPSPIDIDGLSFFRELFSDAQQVAAAAPTEKLNQYFVVRLRASDLRSLGFTVTAAPDVEQPLGHCLVPELALGSYQSNKAAFRPAQVELSKLAARAILISPTA